LATPITDTRGAAHLPSEEQSIPLCPRSLDIDLFAYRDSVINLDAQVSHGAFDLGVAEQELNSTQVSCAPIDQRSLGPPQRVGAVQMRIESDAGEPLGQKPRVLAGGHALSQPPAREQKLARFLARQLDVVVDGLSGWVGQLKPGGACGVFLAHACAIDGIAIGCNVIDFHCDDVAAPELAIDREIEQREVAR